MMIRFILWFVLMATPIVLHAHGGGHEPAAPKPKKTHELPNPLSDYWRKVREGIQGYSTVRTQEATLIQDQGQSFRKLHNGPISTWGGAFVGLSILALAGFYFGRGKVMLKQARSGETIERWNAKERLLHGLTALSFITLALSGLTLLYGKILLIPIIGHEYFAILAGVAIISHNIAGPLFAIALFLMIAFWTKDHLPNSIDWAWFKAYGGLIGDSQPSANKINGGQKAWFWLLVFVGASITFTGFVLEFIQADLATMQMSELIHGALGLLLIAASLIHVYMASIGTEGTLEGMTKGSVDKSWAIQHHDLWYESLNSETKRSKDMKKEQLL